MLAMLEADMLASQACVHELWSSLSMILSYIYACNSHLNEAVIFPFHHGSCFHQVIYVCVEVRFVKHISHINHKTLDINYRKL